MKKSLPAEIVPIEVMRFMNGWNCEDYNSAPAKFIANILTYKKALNASRNQPGFSSPAQGMPAAWKMIMQRMRRGGQ